MANLKDYQLEVESLIAEENWAKAYEICNKILAYDTENITFIKLKKRIEKAVNSINNKAIKEELNNLDTLIREKKYEEYLKSIAPLQSYVTQFPEIGEKILKAKKLLDQEYNHRREIAYNTLIQDIKLQKTTKDYLGIISQLETFSKLGIHQTDILNWIKKVKTAYINEEIQKNQGLINSQKFEDTHLFLLKLKKIDPTNPKINSLIQKVNATYKDFKIDSKRDYIFKTLEEIKTLYLTKKYEYCAELANRVLEIDEKNTIAATFLRKATDRSSTESESKIIDSIHNYFQDFASTKAYKDKNYIKI